MHIKIIKVIKLSLIVFIYLGIIYLFNINVNASTEFFGEDVLDLQDKIADSIKNRETEIIINHKNILKDEFNSIFSYDGIVNLEDDSSIIGVEYDFNALNKITYNQINDNKKDGYYKTQLLIDYRESFEETNYVLDKTKEILKSNPELITYSDYEKSKWIYDYIINNTKYDYSLKKKTTYNALKDGKTICSGFAGLYYILGRELGLTVRIVYGTASGIPHAWNICMINDKWYYVDTTWGETYQTDEYLLVSKKDIKTHILYEEYEQKEYNFSDTKYVEENKLFKKIPLETFGITLDEYKSSINVNEKYKLKIITSNISNVSYESENKEIAKIDKDGNIRGMSIGQTKIIVKYDNILISIPIEVKAKIDKKLKTLTIKKSENKNISNAIIISTKGYNDLLFKSTNKNIVKVSKEGIITGLNKGKCFVKIYNKKTNKYIYKIIVYVK